MSKIGLVLSYPEWVHMNVLMQNSLSYVLKFNPRKQTLIYRIPQVTGEQNFWTRKVAVGPGDSRMGSLKSLAIILLEISLKNRYFKMGKSYLRKMGTFTGAKSSQILQSQISKLDFAVLWQICALLIRDRLIRCPWVRKTTCQLRQSKAWGARPPRSWVSTFFVECPAGNALDSVTFISCGDVTIHSPLENCMAHLLAVESSCSESKPEALPRVQGENRTSKWGSTNSRRSEEMIMGQKVDMLYMPGLPSLQAFQIALVWVI